MSTQQTSPPSATEKELMNSLVDSYREIIEERYQYETLKKKIEMPDGVTREVVDSIRNYFLEYIYPNRESRVRLSAGFEPLKTYASNPNKMLKIVGSFSGAILKFGFYLPRAIRAALRSWDAYGNAKALEIELLKSARAMKLSPPVSKDQVSDCLRKIPKAMLLKFSEEVLFLFKLFGNQALLGKTIEILDEIIVLMTKKSEIYPEKDVKAMIMGRSIIKEGSNLLCEYEPELREQIIKAVYTIEIDCLDILHEERS